MELKKLLRAGGRYLTSPDYRFLVNAGLGFYDRMPDEAYLRRYFRAAMGKELDLEHPQTFNEKLQWLKLHDRKPEYTKMVDKIEAKKYVASILGEEYIIPTLGVWDSPDEIDFDALPEQFVLKCSHDSGGLVIVRNKAEIDQSAVRKILKKRISHNFYFHAREWAYKDVIPKILAEKYMEDHVTSSLVDYKFFNFDGESKFVYCSVGLENHKTAQISFFDLDGREMPFHRLDFKPFGSFNGFPPNFREMIDISNALAAAIHSPFVRIDLYSINGKTYFSEITFTPCAGCLPFEPPEWDFELGSWIKLPAK